MEIEFDPDEDAKNVRKHGFSLRFGAVVIAKATFVVVDNRYDYGETRLKAFAVLEEDWHGCVYTLRGTVHRIISVHRVREKEVRRWRRTRPTCG